VKVEEIMTRTLIFGLGMILTLIPAGLTQDVTFNKSGYSSLKQPRETAVVFTIADSSLLIKSKKETKKMESVDLKIPYPAIDSMSYEFASRHRTQEGAALSGLSLAGGLILMSTKTKSYWLRIDYHEGDAKQSTMLRLDKSEY
jgi:hypothetical protein